MRSVVTFALALTALTACGAPSAQGDELGQHEQPMISDDHFGIRADNNGFCSPGMSATCYYPPGWGDGSPSLTDGVPYEWKVCIESDGFQGGVGSTQLSRTVNGISAALADITANGGWAHWVQCTQSPNIRVRATNLSTTYTASDIRAFMSMACDSSQVLSEVPSIPGSDHRYCYRWIINVEADDLDAFFSAANEPEVYEHAAASGLVAAIVGAGAHTGGPNTLWSYSNVSPIGKHSASAIEYCRARARYDGNGNYFSVTRVDNACD